MTNYLLSIDPGISTGVALLSYTDETAPVLEKAWQFRDGAEGLNEFMNVWTIRDSLADPTFFAIDEWPDWVPATVIAEKFNPRGSGQGFSYTAASLEPLRCEGVLVAHGLPDEYVSPPQQYFAGGKGKAEKKRLQHRALRDLGYYVTGSMVDSPDADDTRSCIAHALSYLSRSGHRPSYNMISEWTERST